MISQREKNFYFATNIGQLLLLVAAYVLNYGIFDIIRKEWIQAPAAYSQLLTVMLLSMVAESMTRPERFRIDAGRLPRRLALTLARRQAIWILGAFAFFIALTRDEKISRLFLLAFTALSFVVLYFTNRHGRRWLQHYSPFQSLRGKLSVLIIGSDEWRASILPKIELHSDFFVILPPVPHQLGDSETELVASVARLSPDLLVLPAREISYETTSELFALGDRRGFRCWVPVELSRRHGRQFELQDLGGVDVLTPPTAPLAEPMNRALKRTMDIAVGGIGVVLLAAPFAAIVFILQRTKSPGPLFSKRPIVGENGIVFQMLSFRTVESAPHHPKQPPYPVAKFLRTSGLQQIPRLINVLRGEMSIVGPQPLEPEETAASSSTIHSFGLRRFLKPGITGLAQLEQAKPGRNTGSTARRSVRYDRFYAQHWSLDLDLRCLLATLIKISKRGGRAAW